MIRQIFFVTSLLACSFLALSASATEERYYLGGMVGQARGDVGAAEMNQRMASLGYDAQAMTSHQNRTAWGLLAGYEWTTHFNIEAGYTDLGKVKTRLSGSVVDIDDYLNSANLVHPRSADGAELTLLGHRPVNEKLGIFARAGVLFADSRYHADAESDKARRSNSSGEFIFGAGVNYELNERWALRAGWNRYRIEDEKINLLGITMLYRIPCSDRKTD